MLNIRRIFIKIREFQTSFGKINEILTIKNMKMPKSLSQNKIRSNPELEKTQMISLMSQVNARNLVPTQARPKRTKYRGTVTKKMKRTLLDRWMLLSWKSPDGVVARSGTSSPMFFLTFTLTFRYYATTPQTHARTRPNSLHQRKVMRHLRVGEICEF